MASKGLDKAAIAAGLRKLGLRAGDIVMVHSSLSSVGYVEGGPATVIEALVEVLTPTGTLLMPTFGGPPPFDLANTSSGLGAITEAFRKMPGVFRSLHPTHSVSAIGARAEEIVRDHIASPTAAGRETPYGRLIELGGKILFVGVDNDRSTTMHTLEEYVEAPYLSHREATYLDENGQEQTKKLRLFPGPHRDFIGLGPLFRGEGVEVTGRIGNAVCRLIDAGRMRDVVLAAFRDDPALVLCDNPNCADCVMQRRKILVARLKQEGFTLSALASSVSMYPDEIAFEMDRAGVSDLVVDRLWGQPVWRVTEQRLRRAAATFGEEGVTVGAVCCPAEASSLEHSLGIVKMMGARAAVVPLPPDTTPFVAAGERNGVEMLFENHVLPSTACLELLQHAGAKQALAFNPASFALLGEKPFLGAFQSRLKHHIGMLFLSDATFGGEYTLPGRGNGEVKELLSILRCRSFSGRVVLATGPGGPPFRDLVAAFWALMESL
jgi:aminoglycoside 3-N-acetyltransferase